MRPETAGILRGERSIEGSRNLLPYDPEFRRAHLERNATPE